MEKLRTTLIFILILICRPVLAQGWQWLNPQPQGNTLRDIYFVDANTGWLVGSGGMILHTKDGGDTWDIQENPTRAWFETVFFVDANNGWAGGAGLYFLADFKKNCRQGPFAVTWLYGAFAH